MSRGLEGAMRTCRGMECSESQGGPSARRSCSAHARYLAKDVLEGASGRKRKTLFLCEPPGSKKASTSNVHLKRFLARCPYFPLLCFALPMLLSSHVKSFNNHLLDPTQQLVTCLA